MLKNIKILSIQTNFDKYFIDLFDFCNSAIKELDHIKDQQIIKNMTTVNWKNNNNCLLYRLFIKKDFDDGNGMLNLIYKDKKIISVSCVSKYNDMLSVIGRRHYCLKEYRNYRLFHDYIMDKQIEWSENKKLRACIILFNESKKILYVAMKRISENKLVSVVNSYYKYKKFIMLEGKYKIYSTQQYVGIYKIDQQFKMEEIKWEH